MKINITIKDSIDVIGSFIVFACKFIFYGQGVGSADPLTPSAKGLSIICNVNRY